MQHSRIVTNGSKQGSPKRSSAGSPTAASAPDAVTASAQSTIPGPFDADARREAIAVCAYLRAERRGFAPGAELADWLEAEAELNRLLAPTTAIVAPEDRGG